MPGQASKENGKKGGRPKGSKSASTLEKERVLAEVRQRIMRKADQLLNAQSSLAQGQQFLYKIEKTPVKGPKGGTSYQKSKPILVTSEHEIQAFLDGEYGDGDSVNDPTDPSATYYYITTKEPNNMAIDSMFDRTFGTAVKVSEVTGKDGKDLVPDNAELIKALTEKLNELHRGTG